MANKTRPKRQARYPKKLRVSLQKMRDAKTPAAPASNHPGLDPAFRTFWHSMFLMKESVALMVADFAPKDGRIGIDSRIRLERRWRPTAHHIAPPWAALATP